jgi:hypothetical protein
MKKTSFIFLFIILFFSCEKYDNTCDCKDPLEDLAWLKELKNSMTNCSCRLSIIQATYHKQTVFYSIMNDPLCNSLGAIILWDCNGNSITSYEPPIGETLSSEVKDTKVIYTCKTGE